MSFWFTHEPLNGRRITALNIILPTRGCYYDHCYMCSYAHGIEPAKDLVETFLNLIGGKQFEKLKIFTSGSFFDEREIPKDTREKMIDAIAKLSIEELTIESRPELINGVGEMKERLNRISLEIAIGLESSNDRVLEFSVNKGFTFSDFKKACDKIKGFARIKAYLLIKPPFLQENEAIKDAIHSAREIEGMVDTISFNPVCIHKNTIVEFLWRRREYRPAWLWSVAKVLNECIGLESQIICHPVALGKERGPHNCPKCNEALKKKIDEYNFTRAPIEHECACREAWERELEEF